MNGMDCLRAEMSKRGMTKSQCESKVVAVVVDILSESGNAYLGVYDAEQTLAGLKREINDAKYQLQELRSELSGTNDSVNYRRRAIEHEIESATRNIEQQRGEIQSYINGFFESLQNCETAEGRDAIKKAQMFRKSIEIETTYDNTAYIIGLSAILSNGKVAAIEEIKKINPKLAEVSIHDPKMIRKKRGRR